MPLVHSRDTMYLCFPVCRFFYVLLRCCTEGITIISECWIIPFFFFFSNIQFNVKYIRHWCHAIHHIYFWILISLKVFYRKCSFRFKHSPCYKLWIMQIGITHMRKVRAHASTFLLLLLLFILHLQSSQSRILWACHNMWFDFVVLDIKVNMWRHVNDTISVCSIWLCIIFLGMLAWSYNTHSATQRTKNLRNVIFFKRTREFRFAKKKLCKREYQCYNVKWLSIGGGSHIWFLCTSSFIHIYQHIFASYLRFPLSSSLQLATSTYLHIIVLSKSNWEYQICMAAAQCTEDIVVLKYLRNDKFCTYSIVFIKFRRFFPPYTHQYGFLGNLCNTSIVCNSKPMTL